MKACEPTSKHWTMSQQVTPMMPTKIAAALSMIMLSAALAGCGGGGDASAGSPTAFSVVPNTTTHTAPTGSPAGVCYSGGSAKIFIYGGAAPYRIDNTSPDILNVDTATVSDRGGSFTVTVTGGCMTTIPIVVVDKLDHTVTYTVTNAPAS